MKRLSLFCLCCCVSLNIFAVDKSTIRVGMQASGTWSWELAAMKSGDPAKNAGFKLETVELANAEAGKIAFQAGAVDMIVSDWIWVSRMRSEGKDFTFYPYSTASGSLMVTEKSAIRSLADLKGKRLGIAGGELDKNWLLLQALAKTADNLDLNNDVEKIFGAPPLINEQLKLGRIDAALNYWHYGTALESQGFHQLLDGQEILKGLGIEEKLPAIGYVFRKSWADSHKTVLDAFLLAGKQARESLCTSDDAWRSIGDIVKSENAEGQARLRKGYCEGQVNRWGEPEKLALERVFALLRKASADRLTGKSEHIQPGTFWE